MSFITFEFKNPLFGYHTVFYKKYHFFCDYSTNSSTFAL